MYRQSSQCNDYISAYQDFLTAVGFGNTQLFRRLFFGRFDIHNNCQTSGNKKIIPLEKLIMASAWVSRNHPTRAMHMGLVISFVLILEKLLPQYYKTQAISRQAKTITGAGKRVN